MNWGPPSLLPSPWQHAGSEDTWGGRWGQSQQQEGRPAHCTRTPSISGAGRGPTKELLLQGKAQICGRAEPRLRA